jgi:hypothetical protein
LVGTGVQLAAEKLVEQEGVGAHHLDPVEPGVDRAAGGGHKILRHAAHFVGRQRTRHAGCDGAGLAILADRIDGGAGHLTRRYRGDIAWLDRDMRHAPDVPELCEYPAALVMHRLGNGAPALGLFVGVQARSIEIATSFVGDRQALGDDQAR